MSDYIKPPKTLPPGSTVITYLRDSGGPRQEESIGQQERVMIDYCKEYGLALLNIYPDSASGRKTKNRDQFLKMFNDVMNAPEDLRPDGLLLWSLSRFSRDVFDFNYYFYGLARQGLIIHSITEEIPDGLAGGVLLSVKAYSNADYSEQMGKAIKRAIADRVKAGYNNGGTPPKGYKVVREYQPSTRTNGAQRIGIKWEPDPELAPLVRLAWELRAQGKSYGELTKATMGRVYDKKNSWASHFRNKSYLGIGKAGDQEYPDHHTPIITWELWDAVKKIEKANKTQADLLHSRRLSNPSLLSGISFCLYCGSAMVLHTAKDYRSYQCGVKDRRSGYKDCPQARSVNARKADRVILDTVLNEILTPKFGDDLLFEIGNQLVDTSKLDREIETTNNLLISTDRSLTRLLRLVEEAGDIEEIIPRLKELKREKIELLTRIKSMKAARAVEIPTITPEALGLVFSKWRAQIENAIGDGDILRAKRLIAYFVSKIELAHDKAIIQFAYPFEIPSETTEGLRAHKDESEWLVFLF